MCILCLKTTLKNQLTIKLCLSLLIFFLSDVDLLFKHIGSRMNIRKPSGVTNIQGVTVMLWMWSAHDKFDMTVFQSKSVSFRLKEKLFIGNGLVG